MSAFEDFATLGRVLPSGGSVTLPAWTVLEILATAPAPGTAAPTANVDAQTPLMWRERLWIVPAETRLGGRELAEAIGRPMSWVYRHTSAKSGLALLPHRRLDGELVFVASEIRGWLRDNEEVVETGHATTDQLSLRRAAL